MGGLMYWRRMLWVLGAWAVSRLVVFADSLRGDVPGDVVHYAQWSAELWAGSFPVGDENWQYPPGAALVFLMLGSSPEGYFRRLTLLAALADALIMLTLLIASRRRGEGSLLGPWVWAIAGFAIGPLLLQRYDLVPTLIAVVALALIARPGASAALAGLGLVVKVWPAFVLLGLPRRLFWRAGLLAVVVAMAVWGLLALFRDNSADFLLQQAKRGLEIEAVAALPLMIAKAAGADITVRGQFGSWEIAMPLASSVALLLTVLSVIALLVLVVARLIGRLEFVPPGDVVLLAVLLFVTTSKVNSPQFAIWLAGIAAVALVDRRSRMLGVVGLLGLMTFLTNGVIWPQFESLMTGNPIMVGYQALRIALLISATAWAVTIVLIRPERYVRAEDDQGSLLLQRN